jgi:hypothetical protein
MEHKIR